ncbi:hypothetical protein DVH24_010789 [Malus domestica]|uniref:RNase H type-1 domain-containing protein n=1 Tax=Malus domestica TaxID=3750 RepID=A0A498JXG0_MALDO|nr:hypothetical protein DVH24_010789 [Malus domestica]
MTSCFPLSMNLISLWYKPTLPPQLKSNCISGDTGQQELKGRREGNREGRDEKRKKRVSEGGCLLLSIIYTKAKGAALLIGGGTLNIDGATISKVEARALKEGLLYAQRKGYTKIMVERDSKLVIQSVLDRGATLWNMVPIIEDIKWMATKFACIDWKHIFREANFVVDVFAHQGLLITDCHIWDHPVFLHLLFMLFSCSRGMRRIDVKLDGASWNVVIGGCLNNGQTEQALTMLK